MNTINIYYKNLGYQLVVEKTYIEKKPISIEFGSYRDMDGWMDEWMDHWCMDDMQDYSNETSDTAPAPPPTHTHTHTRPIKSGLAKHCGTTPKKAVTWINVCNQLQFHNRLSLTNRLSSWENIHLKNKISIEFGRYRGKYEWKEGNVLFNDALNTFYLRLYGVGYEWMNGWINDACMISKISVTKRHTHTHTHTHTLKCGLAKHYGNMPKTAVTWIGVGNQ